VGLSSTDRTISRKENLFAAKPWDFPIPYLDGRLSSQALKIQAPHLQAQIASASLASRYSTASMHPGFGELPLSFIEAPLSRRDPLSKFDNPKGESHPALSVSYSIFRP